MGMSLVKAALVGGALVAGAALASAWGPASARTTSGPDVPAINLAQPLGSPAGSLPTGPRPNGTAVLPDGRIITPAGKEIGVELQPLDEVLSHDGKRLYVSSEGYNDDPTTTSFGDGTNKRFITVIDTTTGSVVAKIRDDALQSGIVESPDGSRLYVSNGATDSIGIIDRTPAGRFSLEPRTIKLDPPEKQLHVFPWGLAMSPDGKRLYSAGFISNTLYTIDINPADGTPHVIATQPTGEYPYGVLASPAGTRVYVSNWGEYNPGDLEYETTSINSQINSPIVPPPVAIAGYNTPLSSSVWSYDVAGGTPTLSVETPIGNQLNGGSVESGSQPSAMALAPDGHTLAVTSSNDDLVELLDTSKTEAATEIPAVAGGLGTGLASLSQHPARVVDLRVLDSTPTGAQPDAVAWSPDGKVLLVAEGGRNSVAVVDVSEVTAQPPAIRPADPTIAPGQNRDAVIGRIPTAWYPDGVVVSPDGRTLWILNDNGLGSGPNTDLGSNGQPIPATYENPSNPAHGGGTDLSYIPSTLYGMVQQVDLSTACGDLPLLSHASDLDNGLVQGTPAVDGTSQAALAGTGYVVPTGYGQPTSDGVQKIKHVFLILKENRSFDQVFGDVAGNERDPAFTDFGITVTPNEHALAREFASSDNYYVNSETSRDGHFSVDTGQVTEFLLKTVPSSYAGKIPLFQGDTNPENLPEGGFIWDNASRAGVKSRIYGEGTYLVGVSPSTLGALGTAPALNSSGELIPGLDALNVSFDPLYPTQAPIPFQNDSLIYQYNDHARAAEFDRDFGKELQPVTGTLSAIAGPLADSLVAPLNVVILFDDHTAGDIGNAPFPRDYVAENDDALGEVVNDIATSPIWHDSAIFVTEDDTQGGQDHVDAHRSFDLVVSPWAKRPGTGPGYVSHVHTSFSSLTKTIDLLLGIPPASLQELTATSLADDFVTGPGNDVPDLTLPVRQVETYGGGAFGYSDNAKPASTADRNYTVDNAPNAALKLAAEIAPNVAPGIDQGGPLGGYDLELEEQGLRELGDPSTQVSGTIEHTLEAGSPAPLTMPTVASSAGVAGCLLAAAHPSSASGVASPPSPGSEAGSEAGSGAGSEAKSEAKSEAPIAAKGTAPAAAPSPEPGAALAPPPGLPPASHSRSIAAWPIALALVLLVGLLAGVALTAKQR